jgi:hypothetical protein
MTVSLKEAYGLLYDATQKGMSVPDRRAWLLTLAQIRQWPTATDCPLCEL